MRMREFVARMGAPKLAEALRCPYEWHEPLKGHVPVCDGKCEACIRQFEFGEEDTPARVREVVSNMTATKMARALRCPFDWFEPLENKDSSCERGEDCNACIQHFLIGCDTHEFHEKRG